MKNNYPFAKFCVLVMVFIALMVSSGCRSKTIVKKLAQKDKSSSKEKPVLENETKTTTDRLDGVTYRLPRTVVQVVVPVKATLKSRGELSDFAPCFFSGSDLEEWVTAPSKKFVIEPPTFKSRGEPDPEETYIVKTKGRYFEAKTVLMEYSPSGTLTKGESESKDETVDFTLKAVGTVVGLGAKLIGFPSLGIPTDLNDITGNNSKMTSDMSKTVKTIFVLDLTCAKPGFEAHLNMAKTKKTELEGIVKKIEELEKEKNKPDADKDKIQEMINKYPEKAKIQEAIKKLEGKEGEIETIGSIVAAITNNQVTDQTPAGRVLIKNYNDAKEVFERMKSLKKKREEVISSAANIPPDTFNKMLAEMDKAIEEYRSAFLGKTSEKAWEGVFEVPPDSTSSQDIKEVFYYSKSDGICTDIGLVAKNKVYVKSPFRNDDVTKPCNDSVELIIAQNSDDRDFISRIALAASNSEITDKSRGWYFRIPARADVWLDDISRRNVKETVLENGKQTEKDKIVEFKRTTLGKNDMMVAQWGAIVSIPATTAGRSSTSSIVLDEATGALKNFKVSSSPMLDKSSVDEADKTLQTIIDAKDPVKQKQRELELLKLLNDINEARKKLNGNVQP